MSASVSAGPEGALPPMLDPARDEVVRSAQVPSSWFPQAEVRLVRRGKAAVLQTVIFSPHLERVVAEIRRKESSAWPPGRNGREESARYVDALGRAAREAERRFRERGARGDRRRTLLIEFVLSAGDSFVAFYDPEVRGDFGSLRIGELRVLEILPLARRYVRENLYEIAVDSLGWNRREAEEALEPLLPEVLQPGESPKNREREGASP